MQQHWQQSGERGFTLVEVLVALTLTGMIAVLISVGLNLGVRAWETISRFQMRNAELVSGEYQLMQILKGARTEVIRTELGETMTAFDGQLEEMIMVAPLRQLEGFDELYWIRLSVDTDRDSGERGLSIGYLPYTRGVLPDQLEFSSLDEELQETGITIDMIRDLLDGRTASKIRFVAGIDRITLEYLQDEIKSGAVTRDDWVQKKDLPDLISVKLYADKDAEPKVLHIRPRLKSHEAKIL